jgi:site-specific recombinase XerD
MKPSAGYKRSGLRFGFQEVTTHTFRHSFRADNLLENGSDIRTFKNRWTRLRPP